MSAATSYEPYPAPPESLALERSTRAELDALQTEGLQALVRRAWERVSFYRTRWERAGVHPEQIRSLDDLRRLPIVTKSDLDADLNEHPPFGTYQGDFRAVRVQASSGTSGNPKPIFHTYADWRTIANFWARRLYAQGVREGDVFQVVFAYSLFIVGFTGTEGAMRLGALVVPAGSGAVTPSERQIRIAREWGTTILFGTPSYVLHLADVAERMGLSPLRDFRLRATIHTSEALTDPMRRAIEERWGVRAFDNFGSVETGAPTFECDMRDGYHVNEDGYIFEVLDPLTYEPAAPGDDGVLVVTSLFKEAAPVIRYNVEDVSTAIDQPCGCGRTFRRIARIRGRVGDMVKIRGVAFYPRHIEAALERVPELTREYVVVLTREGTLDRATVRAECRDAVEPHSALRERIEHELKVMTGLTMAVELVASGELERALAVEDRIKAKRIWDRRQEV